MTTRQRLDLLPALIRDFFRARNCCAWCASNSAMSMRSTAGLRATAFACAPARRRSIYHICAGNLAVSAWTSLAHGLLLGARNVVKLPGDRDAIRARGAKFSISFAGCLRHCASWWRRIARSMPNCCAARMRSSPSDRMRPWRAFARKIRLDQKFIAHGHAVSLLWLADPNRLTARQARACAVDVLTYDQLGCLSPQAIYVPPGTDFEALGEKLARALEAQWQTLEKKPGRPLGVAARIAEARDVAFALGHRVWLPPKKHLGWTLIHDPDPAFQPSPLHGVIYMRQASESKLAKALASVAGRISTVGVAGRLSARSAEDSAFLSLGVSRFCPAGACNFHP